MDKTLERILSLIPKKPDGKFQHGAIKEFANSIGLKSGNLIPDWINGRSSSYKNYLYQIADQYHVSVAWLKGETDEKIPAPTDGDGEGQSQLSPAKQAIIEAVYNLTDEQCVKLLGVINEAKKLF